MTQETGSNPTEKKPWESDWVPKAKQLVTETVDNVKKAVEGVKMPWEDTWKEKPKATPQQGVTEAPKGSIGPLNTEAQAIKAAQLSPKEQAKDAAREKSAGNIAELKAEIAKTKDPKTKKVLEDYLKSLGGVSLQERSDPLNAADKTVPGLNEDLNNLVATARKVPEFNQIEDFLKSMNMVPDLQFEYNDDNKGSFTKGGMRDPGVVRVRTYGKSGKPSTGSLGTIIHEMTHAADYAFSTLSSELEAKSERTKLEDQFLSAYKKTLNTTYTVGELSQIKPQDRISGVQKLARALDAKWLSENSEYRTKTTELAAHATGETLGDASPNRGHKAPTHLNPSVVTEFMLTLDLAQRVMNQKGK